MARASGPRYAGRVPIPTIIALLVALLVGNLLLVVAIAGRRRSADRSAEAAMPVSGEPVELAIEMARDQDGRPASGAGIRLATYDRVIRIVSYTFFMVTAVVVAVSGLWPDSAPAIYLRPGRHSHHLRAPRGRAAWRTSRASSSSRARLV
jgi:hypothetical protein